MQSWRDRPPVENTAPVKRRGADPNGSPSPNSAIGRDEWSRRNDPLERARRLQFAAELRDRNLVKP